MRGAFTLIDIIPGVKALGESMDVDRAATGLLGQSDNMLQVMGKYTLQRTKNLVGQMGRAGRNTKAFIKLLGSNADEAAQMFITKADELGRQVINLDKGKIDDIGTKLDDLVAKGEKVLSGDFGDVKKYFKSLLPGEYTLVATSDGQVFRIAKGDLGETSLELATRNGDGVARTRSMGADGVENLKTSVNYGEQYGKIGNKKVLKPNVEYTDANGYKYVTDDAGRITNAKGNLNLNEGTRNPYAQRTVGGVDRLPTDDGGHLIGNQFNGSGQIDNLVPQNSGINRSGGEWYKMEQDWAGALKYGNSVKVDIKPNYPSNSVRPSSFKVNYWIDREKFTKIIKNP